MKNKLPVLKAAIAFLLYQSFFPRHVLAYNPEETFRQGRFVISAEGGLGHTDTNRLTGGIELWNLGGRFSLLPLGTTGRGYLHGALETGLEPFFQHYPRKNQNYGGLAIVLRYHFLSFGRFVPWLEGTGAAGGTDLDIHELHSSFAFLLHAGAGFSYFLTDNTSAYVGFRYQHISNGELQPPNKGFNAYTGVFGISFFLP